MRRAAPLALVIACACSTRHPAPAIEHTTDHAPKRAPANALGLEDGATWQWSGTRTDDAGTTEVSLTTKIAGDGARFHVTGWPDYAFDAARVTEIVIEDGVVRVDGEPWIRIEPQLESLACPDAEYCWSVEDREIYYRTGPDVTVYQLDERGLAGFTYHHNGTTDDLELHRN